MLGPNVVLLSAILYTSINASYLVKYAEMIPILAIALAIIYLLEHCRYTKHVDTW